jgi:hypothetical protein
MEFKSVRTKNGYEVKTNIDGTWYTIADCYRVPGIGDANEISILIAQLLTSYTRNKNGRSPIHKTA